MQPDDVRIPHNKKSKKTFFILLATWITVMITIAIIYVAKNYERSFSVVNSLDSPAALVNGVSISLRDLNLAMSGVIQSGLLNKIDTTKAENQEKMRKETLDSMIDSELIIQKAKELGLQADPVKVTVEMNALESSFENRNLFLEKLKSVGLTELDVQNDIERQLLITEYQNKVYDTSKDIVKESDIKIFYEALLGKYIELGQTPPTLESSRDMIIAKILERRHQVYLENIAKKMRETAKIEILI